MICKETIKQRKAVYGNSFTRIVELENAYYKEAGTNRVVTEQDICRTLMHLKQARVESIKHKLNELKQSKDFNSALIQAEIQTLNFGLEDSKKDYENYKWISNNYPEYESL